jgi:putative transposase
MALGRPDPASELMRHSDQGSQYTSLAYQTVLAQFHIQVIMSRKGDCYDNAMMESVRRCVRLLLVGDVQPH